MENFIDMISLLLLYYISFFIFYSNFNGCDLIMELVMHENLYFALNIYIKKKMQHVNAWKCYYL